MSKRTFAIFVMVCLSLIVLAGTNALILKAGCQKYDSNYWISDFQKYFKENNIKEKADNLKAGMDDISVRYIDKYIENSKYWNKCINYCIGYSKANLWTDYDKELFLKFENMKVSDIYSKFNFNPYIHKSMYGMLDLPKEVLENINGKDILDIGAWPGDTLITFHENFPKSNIYSYEPVKELAKKVTEVKKELYLKEGDDSLFHIIEKGVGDREYKTKISFRNQENLAQIVKLDDEYLSFNNNLGLIKMDIEGFETPAIEGSKTIIKKYKPVLIIAIYHTPQDFFELKDKIKALNPEYRFMIRRSEDIIADGDLVLIAY